MLDSASIDAIALSIRSLAIDQVETAKNGHPGLPMGLAELGALIYGEFLTYNPAVPSWPNRDRFVLSAGHGSAFLYSLLHLAGYRLSVEDLRNFRQVGSRTPGHPEYGETEGVETTTGPLGQGISNAVGMAIAEAHLAAVFNTRSHDIVDHWTYVIASDGDLMEGVSAEASSLAGHLGLGKLIVFYDLNKISIEGSTDLAFTEDVVARYQAYGWHTESVDAYDVEAIRRANAAARAETSRPSLIAVRSVIGKGSPNKAGTADVHGAALGPDETKLTKEQLGLDPDQEFVVVPEAYAAFQRRRDALQGDFEQWTTDFVEWSLANPRLKSLWDAYHDDPAAFLANVDFPDFSTGTSVATRKASGATLAALTPAVPNLIGGSADLQGSNNTKMPDAGEFSRDNPAGRMFHFGVREHAMGSILNGILVHGGLRPFGATFLTFSDYMKPAIRLAALMKLPAIYVFTHDSIYLGADGPTHQPIEHLAALRAIPNTLVLRPADAQETVEAWRIAIARTDGPSAIVLTRQDLEVFAKGDSQWRSGITRGAYVVVDGGSNPDIVLVATGSEVNLALRAAALAMEDRPGLRIRVLSVISRELFAAQPSIVRETLVPEGSRVVVVEAGVAQGWEGWVERVQDLFVIDRFGLSGPGNEVAKAMGFTAEKLAELLLAER